MALGIRIVKTTGAITKYLQVEGMGADLARNVTMIKIPGDTNLSLDLGISEWDLSLTGVAADSMIITNNADPTAIANFADLVAMRSWGTSSVVTLYFYASSTYAIVKIKGIQLRKEAGQAFWTFQMTLAVESMTVG